ncbi:transposase [Dehalogenimonas formicexedens]|uniref:Transposase n=1 Tax=Dehalogenimonas formicexedens TaxID=1839801 RepID=A0A1P8F5P4_9CHLR|nr:DDE-type integrase/transposase/recombinase [Dehalogenimonas formicexedens]APV43797.1 transposase [Dehalogenimonas formicexedens]
MNNGITCKYCQSEHVSKFGKYKETQLYWCPSCKRKFKADSALFNMQKPPNYVTSALNMFYTGMSYGDISKFLEQEYQYKASKHVLYNWVNKYTDQAVEHYRNEHPKVGDTWIADETFMDVDGRKIFFWDIIDSDTRYLIATRASFTRGTKDAQMLMEAAAKRAGKQPKVVLTDKYRAYVDGIELAFGADTEHRQSRPFVAEDSTNKIERFHNTLKDRTKVMRGFRDIETLISFTDGFAVYYNHFRPHEALHNKTPAEMAGLDISIKNWGDVCRMPISKEEHLKDRAEPDIPRRRYKLDESFKKTRKPPKTSRLTQAGISIVEVKAKLPRLTPRIPREVRRQIGMGR